jgi:predicted 3-demethylubiquinone-9 3-methyltransferase (glyoxalase superfamily)
MNLTTQKIIPHLWYNQEAKEAARFYTSIFPDSEITFETTLHNTPSGDVDSVGFTIWGYKFMAISAGPLFQFNPSVSFLVNFDPSRYTDARRNIDLIWEKLSQQGNILMPLEKYPFSERYGWIQDKFGLSWQLMLTNPQGEPRPTIIPTMMFVGNNCGKAEEAIKFYQSIFKDSKIGAMHRYGPSNAPDKEGTIMFADFMLESQWMAAMDSAHEHKFAFNEAISFMVKCDNQKEIDYYWEKLSAVPEAEQCGWLKDKFGLSWQVVPEIMNEMMLKGTREQIDKVTDTFLKMKKLEIKKLEAAYESKTQRVG